mmetsp:Transcript_25809/g.83344  ORF Transcript_25809/g.83344 Transcript_25809/m.83344 type:complete len:249 (-) Transcript_25809:654-1400(-)
MNRRQRCGRSPQSSQLAVKNAEPESLPHVSPTSTTRLKPLPTPALEMRENAQSLAPRHLQSPHPQTRRAPAPCVPRALENAAQHCQGAPNIPSTATHREHARMHGSAFVRPETTRGLAPCESSKAAHDRTRPLLDERDRGASARGGRRRRCRTTLWWRDCSSNVAEREGCLESMRAAEELELQPQPVGVLPELLPLLLLILVEHKLVRLAFVRPRVVANPDDNGGFHTRFKRNLLAGRLLTQGHLGLL